MIAQGNLDEGVQLLCLIGKSFEACRILQVHDRWTDAAWLAKVNYSTAKVILCKITLGDNESGEVMRRWGNYLRTTKNPNDVLKAVQIFLSLGDFSQVLQLLYDSKRFDTAALFYSG